MGIFPPQADETRRSIIERRTILLFGNAMVVLPTIAYLVFDAQSMFEYGMGFFITLTGTNTVVVYLLFIWQAENTINFIESCQQFIAKSKCQT